MVNDTTTRRRWAYVAIAIYAVVYCAVWWSTSRRGMPLVLVGVLFLVAIRIAGGIAEVITKLPMPLLIASVLLASVGLLASRTTFLTELHTLMFFVVVAHLGARWLWKA